MTVQLALPQPPPHQKKKKRPKKGEFYGDGGCPAERTEKCQAPVELVQPFPALELRVEENDQR